MGLWAIGSSKYVPKNGIDTEEYNASGIRLEGARYLQLVM